MIKKETTKRYFGMGFAVCAVITAVMLYTGCGSPDIEREKPAEKEMEQPVEQPVTMLRTDGGLIVDAHGNEVHIRSENLGGWLAWEQWISNFKPDCFTNQLGRIVGEGDRFRKKNYSADTREKVLSGVQVSNAAQRSVFSGFDDGDYVCFRGVDFDEYLTAFMFRYINMQQPGGGHIELRLDRPNGPLLTSFEVPYTGDNEWFIEEIRGMFAPQDGTHDLYVVADIAPGKSAGQMMKLELMELDNKASADELYDVLVDQVDDSLTLFGVDADVKSGVKIAYDCQPDGIGGYGPGRYIQFSNVRVPAGLTNLAVIAALQNDDPEYQGRYRIEFIDKQGQSTLFGEVPMHDTGGWAAYDEVTIYTGRHFNAGTYDIRVTGVNSAGNDIGNLHSLRFFSSSNADRLIDLYRDVYFTTNDLDRLKAMGFNAVRVPFNYDMIMNDTGELLPESSWTNRLDWIVNECAKRNMYCLLDLHAVPGGQNDYEQCMRKEGIRNRFWYVDIYPERVEEIWSALAAHYKGNPAVLGYDIMNEPAPWWEGGNESVQVRAMYNKRILPINRRIYQAIRREDPDHLIFMEDNAHMSWNSRFLEMLPVPAEQGWSNVVFEIHSYERNLNNKFEGEEFWRNSDILTQKDVADENVRHIQRFAQTHKAPVYIGEFQPGSPEAYDYVLRCYNQRGIHWGHWNYKTWGSKHGWDNWGLQNHKNPETTPHPDLMNDSLDELEASFRTYIYTNYTDNAFLVSIMEKCNSPRGGTPSMCRLYAQTFDTADADQLSHKWCKDFLTCFGPEAAFQIKNQKLYLQPGRKGLTMRLKSRKETEAHFNVTADNGCRFSMEVSSFDVKNPAGGIDAEIRMNMCRDLVVKPVKSSDTPAITACMEYNGASNTVRISLYAGISARKPIYTSEWTPFTAGASLELFVNGRSVLMTYPGITPAALEHGCDMTAWPQGGIAVIDVVDVSGKTETVVLDNFTVQDTACEEGVSSWHLDFTDMPDGINLKAVPDNAWVQRNWSSSRKHTSYVTNDILVLVPYDGNWGGTWLQPFGDYQNSLRLSLGQNVVETGLTCGGFEEGIAKICLMPICFSAGIYGDYEQPALYVEMSRNGENIDFTAYRHNVSGGDRDALNPDVASVLYKDGETVTVQMNTNRCRVYYGDQKVIDREHGITNSLSVYPYGVFPHIEFQNDGQSTNAVLVIEQITGAVKPQFGL